MRDNVVIAETERLVLRRYIEEDLQDLLEYLSNPKDTYIYSKLNRKVKTI